MSGGLSDILTTVQQGVVATNGLATQLSGSLLTIARAPTTQKLTAGTNAIYTPTSSAIKWIEVFMAGAGGGGCGVSNGSSAVIAGSSGGATLFSSWAANGGSGCTGTATQGLPTYGDGGIGGAGTATQRIPGQNGAASALYIGAAYTWTYWGGDSVLGRGAGIAKAVQPQGGIAAAANTGGGGSGSFAGLTAFLQGGGGGGGEFAYLIISSPASSYLYTIGPGGAGGVGTTATGGPGGSGVIYVNEYYAG